MGCDIHSTAERRDAGKWVSVGISPFDWRDYGMYAFLAGVRNYSGIPPIAEKRGWPDDVSDAAREGHWDLDSHSHSWLTVEELENFDYSQPVEDRRYTRQTGPNSWDGGATAEAGHGTMTTYREFLGGAFFREIDAMKAAGAERVVFWFDN